MKKYLTGLFLVTVVAASCSTAHAQPFSRPTPYQARAMRETQVIHACGAMVDLKANVLRIRMKGSKKAVAKQYVRDQLYATVPGIERTTVEGYAASVDDLYAAPPLHSENEIIQVRAFMFQNCVDSMLTDPQ